MSRSLSKRAKRLELRLLGGLDPLAVLMQQNWMRRALAESRALGRLEEGLDGIGDERLDIPWLRRQLAETALEARLRGNHTAAVKALGLVAQMEGASNGGPRPMTHADIIATIETVVERGGP